ncbi:porin family protein [Sediminicola luteus]|uniref:Outer membrane protein beta-barrel domain-containing protein n=1 Tax=Sediminicola luteus TaxID=319238 RepID=A0A2A4GAA5_9FLAO|nr:porin family protein [Sediminicola luteus]PCE64916.1 hypothetical protein B7P33_07065 [Sediminicola luteus]
MKNAVVAVMAAFAFLTQVQGQSTDGKKGDFGFTAGFTSLNARGDVQIGGITDSDSEAYNGFYLGVFKEFALSEKLTLHPEFQFAKYYGQASHGDDNFTDLVLPVLLHYNFSPKFALFAGPRFDYLIPSDDNVENLNEFGVGAQLGAQWELGTKFFVNLSASLGLTERVENDNGPVFGNDFVDVRTQTFNVGFGYRL